jgi:enoyl-CoA hydratase/carnithine racemase
MSNSHVRYEERGDASWVVIDRPHVHNALATQTLLELIEGFRRADVAKTAAIVLTGAGERAFSAGGDIEEMQTLTSARARIFLSAFLDLIIAIRRAKKPVIARVDGYCLGGGNEIAVACDLTVASDRSLFGQVGPLVGSAPVLGSTQLLPRIVGDKRAREIVFLCQRYPAKEALEMGWINRVVAPSELDRAVEEWTARIATMSPQSLRIAKTSLNAGTDWLLSALTQGVEMLSQCFDTAELKEGLNAFLEKRTANFAQFR